MAVPFHCTTSLIPTVSTRPPACSLCSAVKIPPNNHLPQQETPGLPNPSCSPGKDGSVQPCASHLLCTPGLAVGNLLQGSFPQHSTGSLSPCSSKVCPWFGACVHRCLCSWEGTAPGPHDFCAQTKVLI